MIRALAILFGLAFLSGVACLAFQVGDRSPPVTDAMLNIVPNEIEPGRAMQVDVRVFYLRSCQTYVTRHIYDHNGMAYAAPELTLPPGQTGLVHSASTVPLPLAFPPGPGRLVSEPSYGCNWFQRTFWPIREAARVASFDAVARTLP
jgi:hypothetical protein